MISKIFNPDIERGVILSRGSVFFKLWTRCSGSLAGGTDPRPASESLEPL